MNRRSLAFAACAVGVGGLTLAWHDEKGGANMQCANLDQAARRSRPGAGADDGPLMARVAPVSAAQESPVNW